MIAFLNSIPWVAWSILANVAIAATEFLNRTGNYEHAGQAFAHTAGLIVLAQIGLFYAWRDAPTFLTAWAVFTVGNIGLRLLSAHFLIGERLSLGVLIGVGLIVLGGHFVRNGIGASN